MKNKLLFILTSPLFLSLILTVILLVALPPFFTKYKIDLIKKEKKPSSPSEYCDLNNDGYSEQITIIKGYKNRTGIIVRDKGAVVDQWSFKGKLAMENLFYGDFNNDGLKEIFLITINKNKILLNCFNPYEGKKYIIDKYIDDFYPKNGESVTHAQLCELMDLNNDSIDEFVFTFSAGFSISPRRMYSYDFVKDSLYKSPQSCAAIRTQVIIKPFKNKSPFFVTSTAASGNCDSNAVYTDQFSWLMVFDKDLKFKFEPIKIDYYPSELSVSPFVIDKKMFLVTLSIYQGNKNYPCSISLYDLDGNKIKDKEFQYTSEWETASLLSIDKEYKNIYLAKRNGSIEKIDGNLNFKKQQKILQTHRGYLRRTDVDIDNKEEFIFHSRNKEKITILRNDFSEPIKVDVHGNNVLLYSSVILNGKEKPQLFLRFDKYSYYFNYYKNLLYNFQYLFYGLIYLGFYILVFLLQKAQKYRVEQIYKAEKKIAELQIKSIKNQTDPHFTLNIINSIGSLFAKQETEKANYVFGKYSKLLRSTILSSDQILTTLDDEIEYIENYLSLEEFRFKEGFNFNIEKEDGINGKIKIPKMLIHTFVENAIKHGIKHIEERGNLIISISNGTDAYKIKIRDNGIGRIKAREINSFGTGKGLEIMNQILDLYFTLEKVKISYKILDLTNDKNEPLGTEVIIKIPIFP